MPMCGCSQFVMSCPSMFIAPSRAINRLIKELAHQAIEFQLLVKLHGAIDEASRANVVSQVILDQDKSINDLAEGDILGMAFPAQVAIAGFDLVVRLVAKPFPEVAINVVGAVMKLLMGKLVIGLSMRVALKVFH